MDLLKTFLVESLLSYKGFQSKEFIRITKCDFSARVHSEPMNSLESIGPWLSNPIGQIHPSFINACLRIRTSHKTVPVLYRLPTSIFLYLNLIESPNRYKKRSKALDPVAMRLKLRPIRLIVTPSTSNGTWSNWSVAQRKRFNSDQAHKQNPKHPKF